MTSPDVICHNVVLASNTDLGHIDSESDDDPLPHRRDAGEAARQRPQRGGATLDSDSDDDAPGPRPDTGGSSRQRPQGSSALAAPPRGSRHNQEPERPRPQRDAGADAAIPPIARRDNGASSTTTTLTPDCRCYVCTGRDKPGASLSADFCTCGLPVHAKCIKKWMNVSINLAGEVNIYSRDICSACKGMLNVEEIARVSRNDRLQVGGPQRPDRTTAPAPIMRAATPRSSTGGARRQRLIKASTSPTGSTRPSAAREGATRRDPRRWDQSRAQRVCPEQCRTSLHTSKPCAATRVSDA